MWLSYIGDCQQWSSLLRHQVNTGERRKYLLFHKAKGTKRSNRHDYRTPVSALWRARHQCTDGPWCIQSPPTSEYACMCVCVWVWRCVCACFTYHLTGSWYPRNKRIVSEIAGRGSRWRSVVGGRGAAVCGASRWKRSCIELKLLTPPSRLLHAAGEST